ncbi:MAG TPA: fused MFS/spermidine synthase [Longimicrobiales bacterium]
MEVAIAAASRPLAGASAAGRVLPLLYAGAIFWSAALLFWIEPLVSKQLLPLLGGSPGVWNTCLVFFQAVLLAGYAFAHLLAARLDSRRAVYGYLAVLGLAAAALATGISNVAIHGEPGRTAPIPWVLLTLLASVGLPFFALAATGPTLQRWFSLTSHPSARDPYFLYAASNLGSMVGLLAFPSVLEPFVTTSRQVIDWTGGYLVLLALAACCALALTRFPAREQSAESPPPAGDLAAAGVPAQAAVRGRRRLRWLFLAFVPSSLLLGVTTYLSTDIAAVPLLWIVPLAIYLASFTLTFAGRPPIPHRWVLWVAPVVAAAWVVSVPLRWELPFWSLVLVQLLVLFAAAMACHGELAKDRPAPKHLTEFYLWVSLGGVLGGAFNTLLAPLLFTNTTEYPLGILLAVLAIPGRPRRLSRPISLGLDAAVPVVTWGLAALLFHLLRNESDWWLGAAAGAPVLLALPFSGRPLRLALALAAVYVTGVAAERGSDKLLYANRDFYGRIRVLSVGDGHAHELMHGTTLHGKQNMLPRYRRNPLTYYSRRGPVGQIFAAVQGRAGRGRPAHVAGVGLGTGTLAAYALPGESWTFYELNPAIEKVATNPRYFTYFSDALARPAIVLGDARLSLRRAPPAFYDLIVLDAFSSDAIPIHLITREAIRLYETRLAPGGMMAFNISNRYLDLEPVLAAVARDDRMIAWYRDDSDLNSREENAGIDRSEWVVLARSKADLGPLAKDTLWAQLPPTRLRAWSDDFSGLLSIVQW